jgi:5-oxoprolinase (ATP-hydrolysing)
VARALGIRTVLLHPLAGLLSAYGIGLSESSWDGQRDAGRVALPEPGRPLPQALREAFAELEADGRAALRAEGIAEGAIRIERWLDLRYRGTETPLAIRESEGGAFAAAFAAEHLARFGYTRTRPLEIVTARVRARGPGRAPPAPPAPDVPRATGEPRHTSIWFPDAGRVRAPIRERESLRPGETLRGPLLLLEDTGTAVLDPGFSARVAEGGLLVIEDAEGAVRGPATDLERFDPIRLEVFGNRFMSIAEQMGAVLRNTAVSTNIKERLDFSCAVFDAEGGLVANAPHIPVHLGAMGETVRAVREEFADLADGDVVVTNDPFKGGSHLPDVTVVTPVFASEDEATGQGGRTEAAPPSPTFFVASRGHHADLGGTTPGSMPADSRSLADEGVLLRAFRLVQDGRFDEARARSLLTGARHPARNPDDNLADFEAMVAANRGGVRLLRQAVRESGLEAVQLSMRELQQAAAQKVAREIGRLPDGQHRFEDRLDDGTPICVELTVRGERMSIDFRGTGPASAGNLNAPRAVVQAAVIYVLRALVAERIPLNGGCLDPVEIAIPAGSLLDPPAGSAVVGGNVETSQRIVDVLLGAIGRVAASQGTMNNVAFGDERFGYYETIGGGAGAGDGFDGASGVHTHMTNTRITDPEVLEARYPVRLLEFSLRRGSGGGGRWCGGDGLVRRYGFLAPVTLSLLTERRDVAPYGLRGGAPGAPGRNAIVRRGGETQSLPGKAIARLETGDELVIETPGGGGYGEPAAPAIDAR